MSWALSCPVGASLAAWVIIGTEIKWIQMQCDGRHLPGWYRQRHTSTDYCTINHAFVNGSAFIIRTPIRHLNLCSPSYKPQIRKRAQESVTWQQYAHRGSQRSRRRKEGSKKKMFSSLCFALLWLYDLWCIFRHQWGVQIYSIKRSLLRGRSDCSTAELGSFSSKQRLSCPKSKEIMFD